MAHQSNGRYPRPLRDGDPLSESIDPLQRVESSNPYLHALRRGDPEEVADYDMATYPYGNMLPGIANINAARVVAGGMQAGRSGRRGLRIVSAVMLLVLLAPLILAVVDHIAHL